MHFSNHTNRPQEVQETHQWLLTHRRTVPRHFSFLADASKHLGRNGITMKWDLARSTTPRFECDIDAAEVRINATGTAEVEVDMGRGGLGLQGDVKVLINGKEAYSGPVKKAKFKVQ